VITTSAEGEGVFVEGHDGSVEGKRFTVRVLYSISCSFATCRRTDTGCCRVCFSCKNVRAPCGPGERWLVVSLPAYWSMGGCALDRVRSPLDSGTVPLPSWSSTDLASLRAARRARFCAAVSTTSFTSMFPGRGGVSWRFGWSSVSSRAPGVKTGISDWVSAH
jgi:hypothetical protein